MSDSEPEPKFGCLSALFNRSKKQKQVPHIYPSITLKYGTYGRGTNTINSLKDLPYEIWSELPWCLRYRSVLNAKQYETVKRIAIDHHIRECKWMHRLACEDIQITIVDEFDKGVVNITVKKIV